MLLSLTDRSRRYDQIHIVGNDSSIDVKKFKMKSGVRLKLLRRTLRERRVLAGFVHELKVPNLQKEPGVVDSETINLVASIVMACPNLERLIGFHHIYGHEFDRLTHALSTRRKLKEHTWIIGENTAITKRSQTQLPPGLMDYDQAEQLLSYHENWPSLTTLVLHSHNQGVLEHDIFIEIFHRLPSLRHLSVSSFDIDDFNDMTLQYIPALQSLRLESLDGITDAGLSRLASATHASNISQLSLINLNISSLLVISKLLAHLSLLTRFVFVSATSPEIPPGELVFQPILASASLSYLHWDIRADSGTATDNVTSSIRASGFPSLRTIRAPTDHHGTLQNVCKPRSSIVLPSDKYSTHHRTLRSTAPAAYASTLHASRARAQDRLDKARQTVQFKVVIDEDSVVQQIYDFNGFIGMVGSKIYYTLKPDAPGSDDALFNVEMLLDGTKEGKVKEGCSGLWNASHHAGNKWWWHTERWRFRREGWDVSRFF